MEERKKINGVSQLTRYERSRFIQNRICIKCGGILFDDDVFYMTKRRMGHRMFYFFEHENYSKCVEEAYAHG